MMRTRRESDEVLYPDEPIVVVGPADIEELKAEANESRRRIRLCTHRDVADRVHEMLIVHERGTYVRPHKHLGKSESFHVIEGLCCVVLFDDAGQVLRVVKLGDHASGRPFYYRISDPNFHTLLIESEMLVFHETTAGPFKPAETVFAHWAPEDGGEAKRYLDGLRAFLEGTPRVGDGK
jgi:cupin fold WbuC family metalloprotein